MNLVKKALLWYCVLVVGGMLLTFKTMRWLLHDLGCLVRDKSERRVYKHIHPALSFFLSGFTMVFGLVLYAFNITLILPLLIGIGYVIPAKTRQKHGIGKNWHYYDGVMYAITVDPFAEEVREKVADYIDEDSNVIDICCGTGALAFHIADKCSDVKGVDHAIGMVRYAEKQKGRRGISNVDFLHMDASDLSEYGTGSFDYAVISMSIHEMPLETGIQALKEAKRIARRVIVADYAVPQPMNSWGLIFRYMEVIAGVKHLKGFIKYNRHNGLDRLLEECGLEIEEKTKASKK
jgi:SAM-dependent methyltransferase